LCIFIGGPPEGNWWQLPHLKSLPEAKLESKHIPRFYESGLLTQECPEWEEGNSTMEILQ